MESNLKYEILKGLPPYGEMYVSIPKESYSEGLPVRFTKNDGTKWVANFECGNAEFNYISELKNSEEILIIANGICYIIDRNKTEPIKDFGYDFNKVLEFKNQLILIGTRDIATVESSEKIEEYDHLCLDYIKHIQIINGILSGVLYDYNGSDTYSKTKFTIDLKTNEFTRLKGKYKPQLKPEFKNTEQKKWWEIWK